MVLVEQAVLPALQVLRDFKVYAVKPASLDPLALPEVVDREVSPVSPEKMSVALFKFNNFSVGIVLVHLLSIPIRSICS